MGIGLWVEPTLCAVKANLLLHCGGDKGGFGKVPFNEELGDSLVLPLVGEEVGEEVVVEGAPCRLVSADALHRHRRVLLPRGITHHTASGHLQVAIEKCPKRVY